jgi:Protein of unknown function (DUF1580)
MIDFRQETIVTMNQAARVVPKRRRGRPAHAATLYRWASRGCRGIKLEFIQVGGSKCTSLQALQRFFDQLSKQDEGSGAVAVTPSSRRLLDQRSREEERTTRLLDQAGL